ncbi:MAG TPA: PilT/PilU family type 4a pilus ATPase [Vicinamibacterales bacterium]|nr:PilT/PilU family type 4a pilus ATPase [Vicinamibacterales bacterium]
MKTAAHVQPEARIATPQLIEAMLNAADHVSDLIFSPGRAPQIESKGELIEVKFKGLDTLSPRQTMEIAEDLLNTNAGMAETLKRDGSVDISYALPGVARFRVNIFRQRASFAVVMRVIPMKIPSFQDLGLPEVLRSIVPLRMGIVLVTGPTGSGKSSTLAAIVDRMNEERPIHIVTIEDPIEFLHPHKRATIHQRELHSDTPTFSLALRAALRQAPKVILVGEMRDRETIEIAIEAAETGHLVLSTLHTIDASKTVERIVGTFPPGDQRGIRTRFAKTFQYIVSQRLVPKKDGSGRVALLEILKGTLRTRDYVELGEGEGKTLLDAMKVGTEDGMQHFDGEIEKLIRAGVISVETGLSYATNVTNLRIEISDVLEEARQAEKAAQKAAEKAGQAVPVGAKG